MFEELGAMSQAEDEIEVMPIFSIEEEDESSVQDKYPDKMPILALKNTVLFPGIIIPITVGREKSIKAIQKAYNGKRMVGVLSQMDSKVEDPIADDLFKVGTVARIIKLLKMPDNTTTVILQGRKRFRLLEMTAQSPYLEGAIEALKVEDPKDDMEFKALISSIRSLANEIIQLSPNIPSEASVMVKNIANDRFLLNFIASNLGVDVFSKQEVLELDNTSQKAHTIYKHMNNELKLLQIRDSIDNKVRGDIEKQQRDYFLNQQLKTIQEELGQNPQEIEIKELLEKAKSKKWGKQVGETFEKELQKLQRMNPQTPDYSVLLNYLELVVDLPWGTYSHDNFDLNKVQKVLDKDHFGLEKVKERIMEHLAVLALKKDMKAPILCLVGPPGVGKTSLGRSVATALGREYVRISLGGLHDESEIRGHRKTYIGAMPGRIIQSLKKAGTSNPVFILDEIDKVGKDFRGDPSSALLEVLDPEQNSSFHDNYLDIDYDLSKVLFIATANSLSGIQTPLLDRMEVIQLSGYSTEEKIEIAKEHIVPQERKEHGLKATQVKLKDALIAKVIDEYTRESGVRSLKREIGAIMRKVAKKVAMHEPYNITVKENELVKLLGPVRYTHDEYTEANMPGVAIGLAWTAVGGEILFIETSLSSGKGGLILTGNLGDVMKESASTALSYLKAHHEDIGLSSDIFESTNIHIHIPEGAIPKDGPSAGITMLTALASAFTKRRVRPFLAMTGEITLRGRVLPVGGIKEKLLAAKRAGMKEIILCSDNKKHVEEIEPNYLEGLSFHYVKEMSQVLDLALEK
jgi:ATP-dependent Lon protease